jgi:hypothetical protein
MGRILSFDYLVMMHPREYEEGLMAMTRLLQRGEVNLRGQWIAKEPDTADAGVHTEEAPRTTDESE